MLSYTQYEFDLVAMTILYTLLIGCLVAVIIAAFLVNGYGNAAAVAVFKRRGKKAAIILAIVLSILCYQLFC